MKRLIVAAGSLAVFRAGWCFGNQQAAKPLAGGSTWKGVEDSERQLYAVGFKQGYVRGVNGAGALAIMKYDDKKVLASLALSEKKQLEADVKETQKATPVISDNSALVLTTDAGVLGAARVKASCTVVN